MGAKGHGRTRTNLTEAEGDVQRGRGSGGRHQPKGVVWEKWEVNKCQRWRQVLDTKRWSNLELSRGGSNRVM